MKFESDTEQRKSIDAVVAFIGNHFPVDPRGSVALREFAFGSLVSCVGIVPHRMDVTVSIILSLGLLSRRLFLLVVDGCVEEFARIAARLERHDACVRELGPGQFLELDDTPTLRLLGWVGYQITQVEDVGPTAYIPERLNALTHEMEIVWVLPLSKEELELRKTSGEEALLDSIVQSGRDLTSALGSSAWSGEDGVRLRPDK